MRRSSTVVAVAIAAVAAAAGACSTDACRDAKDHYCSKLPQYDCSDGPMQKARNSVISACGSAKADTFFDFAYRACEASRENMKCP